MPHLTEDDLLLLAFGEQAGQAATGHLDTCGQCRAEVTKLEELVGIGRRTAEVRDLPAPPQRVWEGIAAQTATATATPVVPVVPVVPAGGRRARLRLALVGAAVALAAVVGGWAVLRAVPGEPVVAVAALSAFGTAPAEARGEARVLQGNTLTLDVSGLPSAGNGYHEVWLIDPDTMEMFSVGVLGGSPRAAFTLPPNVDLAKFRLVDVSAERFDNRPAHSGDSLLRGSLSGTG